MQKQIITTLFLSASLLFMQSVPVMAVTEEEVAAVGKEAATGNLLIWFLCAIAFLKISQKIDSFMKNLGIHVGETGSSMLSELMVAAKGLATVKTMAGVPSSSSRTSSGMHTAASAVTGGLSGIVSRQFLQSAVQNVTGQTAHPVSSHLYESSLQKGGDFATSVTGAVAKGSFNHTGSMQGPQAAQALSSYFTHPEGQSAPAYENVEIGGGRIMGTEISPEHPEGISFGLYNTDQYMPPSNHYDTVTAQDNSTWYRQYAADFVEKNPYLTETGDIAYHEQIIKKLPDMPKRKDKV